MDSFYDAEYTEINSSLYVNETFDDDIGVDAAVYLKVLSVLIIRAGLFIAEVISIPSSNIQVLVLHNMIDMSVTFLGYGLVGYILAFGDDFRSLIGIRGFVTEDSNFNDFLQGWSILVIVSGLITASIGDRVSFFFGLVLNLLTSCITFPILFHWVLSPKGWMRGMRFAGVYVSYKDYCYSCLVHMAGGYISFLGMLVLDKRMLRFKDLDSSSIPDVGPNLALFGYFLTLLGFIGFSVPTRKYIQSHLFHNFYGIVLVNIIFSVAGTMSVTLFLTFICPCQDRVSKWASLRFAQGGISGVAIIAGGADIYHPLCALCAGAINGVIFFLETHIINKTNLEDFCNISAVHFFSGFMGTLLPPLIGVREGFSTIPYNDFIHFSWQLLCNATVLAYLGAVFYPVLTLFDRCGVLRTCEEQVNHKRAVSTMKVIPKMTLKKRLFDWGEGDFTCQSSIGRSKPFADDFGDHKFENVNVLFQKKCSERYAQTPKTPIHGTGDDITKDFRPDLSFQSDQKSFLPMFEQIDSVSAKTSDSTAKDGSPSLSKTFESNMLKGIRNISDSKLFSRLKENMGKANCKRQSCESRSGFSSVSNMWVASTSGPTSSLETEV